MQIFIYKFITFKIIPSLSDSFHYSSALALFSSIVVLVLNSYGLARPYFGRASKIVKIEFQKFNGSVAEDSRACKRLPFFFISPTCQHGSKTQEVDKSI